MDKKEFIKLINILVDKKLKEILPSMIENEIKKQLSSGIQPDLDDYEEDDDLKNLIPHNDYKNPIIRDDSKRVGTRTENKNWTKNQVINDILNKTAKDFTPLPKDPTDSLGGGSYQRLLESEYSDMSGEFSFNTKNMVDVVNRTPALPGKAAVNNLKNQVVSETGAPPEIVNAMVKDYSKTLKNMDKFSKKKRGGGLPLGSGIGEDW